MYQHIYRAWCLAPLIFLQSINYSQSTISRFSCSSSGSNTVEVERPFWHPYAGPGGSLDMSFLEDSVLSNSYGKQHYGLASYYENASERWEIVAAHKDKARPIITKIEEVLAEDRDGHAVTVLQGFQTLWQMTSKQLTGHDYLLQRWFDFLVYAITRYHDGDNLSLDRVNGHPKPHMRIAMLHGIYSLRFKFRADEPIIRHTQAMLNVMNIERISPPHTDAEWPWGKVLHGEFSEDLLNSETLQGIVGEDLFGKALKSDVDSVQKITSDFQKYSSYRRVLALAIFNQLTLQKPVNAGVMKVLNKFFEKTQTEKKWFDSRPHSLLEKPGFFAPYEVKLVEKIQQNLRSTA